MSINKWKTERLGPAFYYRSGLLLLLVFFQALALEAQQGLMKRANTYFDRGQLSASIPLYHKALDRADVPEAKIRLAEAYRRIGDYRTAVQWYALVMGLEESKPKHRLEYGFCLLRTGDCEAAERWFREYLNMQPYDSRKPALENACEVIRQLQIAKKGVAVQNLNLNTAGQDMAPAFFRDGLVYTSTQRRENDGRAYTGLFFAAKLEGDRVAFAAPQRFSSNLDQAFHEGVATFNPGQDEIFFTRTRQTERQEERLRLEISAARLLPQGNWSALKPLPFSSDTYSVAHPSVSKDGERLYFSSDMPGGQGGKDLYVSVRVNGSWSEPINLGGTINTEGDEVFPYIAPDGSLYFSSDGLVGLGGQDLYHVREDASGLWGRPENLGAPLNTSADDFAIIVDSTGRSGYFTSNREGGRGGDDLYYFEQAGRLVRLEVFAIDSGEPLGAASLLVGEEPDTVTVDQAGQAILSLQECTFITAARKGYVPKTVEVCPQEMDELADTLVVAVALDTQPLFRLAGVVFDQITGRPLPGVQEDQLPEPPPADTAQDIFTGFERAAANAYDTSEFVYRLNVYYDVGRSSVQRSSVSELIKLRDLLLQNPELRVAIHSHTDSEGSAASNQRLSQKRADKIIQYLIGQGVDRYRLQAEGFGENRLVNDCSDGVPCSEEEHQKNRRTVFQVID